MKREMRVSFVKPETRDVADTSEYEDHFESVGEIVQDTVRTIVAGALMYVVADTFRQVILNKLGGK